MSSRIAENSPPQTRSTRSSPTAGWVFPSLSRSCSLSTTSPSPPSVPGLRTGPTTASSATAGICSTSERLPTTTPWTSTHRTSFSPMKSKRQRRARSTPVSPVPKMSSAPSKTVPSETSMKPSAAMETPWRKRASTWAMQSMKRSKQTVSRTRPTTASGSQASRSWSSSGSTD